MNKIRWGRFTFIILMFLILTSLIQVGILWNHRFLFGLLPISSNNGNVTTVDYKIAREEFFAPCSVRISEGIDKFCYVINDKENETYIKLWEEAKSYLKTILNSNKSQVVISENSLDINEWSKITASKSITLEFKTNIKLNLLSWFLEEQFSSPEIKFSGVYKMVICPLFDSIDSGTSIIYIRDDKRIYKFTVNEALSGRVYMKSEDYIKEFDKVSTSSDTAIKYNVIKAYFPDIMAYGPDLLGVINGPTESHIGSIICSSPEGLRLKGVYTDIETDDIAKRVIGSEKDGFNRSIDPNNTIEYTTQNNIYRVYGDGLVEYKYLPEILSSDKGEPGEAFQNAYKYISRLISSTAKMVSGARLYLSYLNETQYYYEFGFDYILNDTSDKSGNIIQNNNGIPIVFSYKLVGDEQKQLQHAITIKANAKNVIECYSILKSFVVKRNSIGIYDVAFTDLMDKAAQEISGFKKLQINDATIVFDIKSVQTNQTFSPIWLLKADPIGSYLIPMFQK